jgi:hypothetical protein
MMQARKDRWKALKQSKVAKEDLVPSRQTQVLLLLMILLLDKLALVMQSQQLVLQYKQWVAARTLLRQLVVVVLLPT